MCTYVSYYVGAYGRTTRIYTGDINWLISFKESLGALLSGCVNELDICKFDGIEYLDAITELVLQRVRYRAAPVVLIKKGKKDKKVTIRWRQNNDEIDRLIGLIDGMLDSGRPGHQYLAEEGDGCVIELSYRE